MTERPTSKLIITDEEVEVFLWWGAHFRDLKQCPIEECVRCEKADTLWWEWCNSLHGVNRVRLQKALKDAGVPLPPGPTERAN